MDLIGVLLAWSPYLLGGFAWNVLIALVAMLIGTLMGTLLAAMRLTPHGPIKWLGIAITELGRNIPTIVFQFYLVMMLPVEWHMPGGWTWVLPAWLKASIALAVAVIGFTSDNLLLAMQNWRLGRRGAALLFIPSWGNYLIIIVLASSTASIIGVAELVSRCNTLIAATPIPGLMVPVYLFASLVFLISCYPCVWALGKLRQRLAEHHSNP